MSELVLGWGGATHQLFLVQWNGRQQLAPFAELAVPLPYFLILFGTGVSPLPGSAAESFATRVNYILVAIAYTIFMAALLWPGPRRRVEDRLLT